MTYTYKKQGDGRDSWLVEDPNGNRYMVYSDPNIKTITTLSDDELIKSFKRLKELGVI